MLRHAMSRKIQKLGSSSLVITIPKGWAFRLGLKPGDKVVVIDEGDYLKVAPLNMEDSSRRKLTIRSEGNLDNKLLDLILECAYKSGASEVVVEPLNPRYQALEAYHNLENMRHGVKRVKIGDETRRGVDPSSIIKLLNSRLYELLERIGESGYEHVEIRELLRDLARTLSLRHMNSNGVEQALAGRIVGLLEALTTVLEHVSWGVLSIDREVLDDIKFVVSEILGGLASGSVRRIQRALEHINLTSNKRELEGSTLLILVMLRKLAETTLCYVVTTK